MLGGSGCTGLMVTRSSPSTTGSRTTSGLGRSVSIGWMSCWRSSKKNKRRRAMGSGGTAKVTLPTDTQILITREFDAPKHLVYKAWTTPELIKRWWSGEHGIVTSAEVDLRVGGRWRYVMAANSGFEVAFHGEYREIVPNERIVATEVFEGMPGAEEAAGVSTNSFTETNGRTTLTILAQHPNREIRDMVINSGMETGMQEQMDRLEQVAVSLN